MSRKRKREVNESINEENRNEGNESTNEEKTNEVNESTDEENTNDVNESTNEEKTNDVNESTDEENTNDVNESTNEEKTNDAFATEEKEDDLFTDQKAIMTRKKAKEIVGKLYHVFIESDPRVYVGSTIKSLPQRLFEHQRDVKDGGQTHWFSEMRRLGPNNFEIKLIAVKKFPAGTHRTIHGAELNKMEVEEMSKYKPEMLFNTNLSGRQAAVAQEKGRQTVEKHTEEDRNRITVRMSKARLKRGSISKWARAWQFQWHPTPGKLKIERFKTEAEATARQNEVYGPKPAIAEKKGEVSYVYHIKRSADGEQKDGSLRTNDVEQMDNKDRSEEEMLKRKLYVGETSSRLVSRRLNGHRKRARNTAFSETHHAFYEYMRKTNPLAWDIVAVHVLYDATAEERRAVEDYEIERCGGYNAVWNVPRKYGTVILIQEWIYRRTINGKDHRTRFSYGRNNVSSEDAKRRAEQKQKAEFPTGENDGYIAQERLWRAILTKNGKTQTYSFPEEESSLVENSVAKKKVEKWLADKVEILHRETRKLALHVLATKTGK